MFSFLTTVQSSAALRLLLWLSGTYAGTDAAGNRYFTAKPKRGLKRERRFVLYASGTDASQVPAEWHGWLHHQTNAVPSNVNPLRRPWQKPHLANQTGTQNAYTPAGHASRGGVRDRATGDYHAWTPNE